MLEWPDGRREAPLFVVEQQSDPRSFSTFKLARYCLEIAELMDTTRVVPVVVFLKANRQQARLTLGNEFFDYLQFRYIRATLAQMLAERYLERDNLVARLNLPNMHWPAELKLAIYASAIRGPTSLERNPDKQVKYLEFVDIYPGGRVSPALRPFGVGAAFGPGVLLRNLKAAARRISRMNPLLTNTRWKKSKKTLKNCQATTINPVKAL